MRKRKQVVRTRSDALPSIQQATRDYDAWVRHHLTAVDTEGLAKKHKKMKKGSFEFLRATFYRWMQRWPGIAGDLQRCPRVLAVGDLHIENFGTWRDEEGRLVWGINDFDEAYHLPYAVDLVRLATSVLLAIADHRLELKPASACRAILRGYRDGLKEGGQPIILGEEQHEWLRRLAQSLWETWEPLQKLKKAKRVPRAAAAALQRALPRESSYDLRRRRAGLGGLGRPRFVALGVLHGGAIAREAKATVPSAAAWALRARSRSLATEAASRAVRAPDPFYRREGAWLVRRLAPDCGKLELSADEAVQHGRLLLEHMGQETANVHLGSAGARERILADLDRRRAGWLEEASARGVVVTTEDWKSWRG